MHFILWDELNDDDDNDEKYRISIKGEKRENKYENDRTVVKRVPPYK